MKKVKISANEINRFVYCPYQWYYGKVYGQKTLREKYKALPHKKSKHESNFVRGLKFHKNYYRLYRVRLWLKRIMVLILLFALIGVWAQCHLN